MNEDAPRGGGNPLTQKFGPLPVWGWLALITGVLLAYYLWSRRNSSSSSSSTAPAPVVVDTPNVQSTTPTAETGLTAAQEAELADLAKDDAAQDAASKKKKPKPKHPPKPKPKPRVPATHGATAHPSSTPAVKAA